MLGPFECVSRAFGICGRGSVAARTNRTAIVMTIATLFFTYIEWRSYNDNRLKLYVLFTLTINVSCNEIKIYSYGNSKKSYVFSSSHYKLLPSKEATALSTGERRGVRSMTRRGGRDGRADSRVRRPAARCALISPPAPRRRARKGLEISPRYPPPNLAPDSATAHLPIVASR